MIPCNAFAYKAAEELHDKIRGSIVWLCDNDSIEDNMDSIKFKLESMKQSIERKSKAMDNIFLTMGISKDACMIYDYYRQEILLLLDKIINLKNGQEMKDAMEHIMHPLDECFPKIKEAASTDRGPKLTKESGEAMQAYHDAAEVIEEALKADNKGTAKDILEKGYSRFNIECSEKIQAALKRAGKAYSKEREEIRHAMPKFGKFWDESPDVEEDLDQVTIIQNFYAYFAEKRDPKYDWEFLGHGGSVATKLQNIYLYLGESKFMPPGSPGVFILMLGTVDNDLKWITIHIDDSFVITAAGDKADPAKLFDIPKHDSDGKFIEDLGDYFLPECPTTLMLYKDPKKLLCGWFIPTNMED